MKRTAVVGNVTSALALDEPYILRLSYATCRSWDEVQQKWRDNNCEVRTAHVRVTQHNLTSRCVKQPFLTLLHNFLGDKKISVKLGAARQGK